VSRQREHERFAHEAAVTLRLGKKLVEGRTRNLSRGGLCADLADPVPVGIDIDIDIALVFEEEQKSDSLRLPARVVWCTPVDDAHQVGIQFRPLDAQRAEYLNVCLRSLDDAKTEKAPRHTNVDDRFR
jgi:Tfp pilus assembly protein PilZ